MAKLNSCKMVNHTVLEHESKNVASLVGGKYDALWSNIEKAIQTQTFRNAQATQACLHTLITGNGRSSALNPEIQEIVTQIAELAHIEDPKVQQHFESLLVSCISAEKVPEARASVLYVTDTEGVSRKIYNIRFHLIDALFVVSDWIALGEITKADSLSYILRLVKTFWQLYGIASVKFDETCAALLREWYAMPKDINRGVDENILVERVVNQYADCIRNLSKDQVFAAVNSLVDYHCAEVVDGRFRVIESLKFE